LTAVSAGDVNQALEKLYDWRRLLTNVMAAAAAFSAVSAVDWSVELLDMTDA